MFAVYTSIAPTVTAVGGMPESAVSAFLLARTGHGCGHLGGGRLADWSVFRSLLGSSLAMGLVIAAGYGYRSPGLVGAGLSVAGFLVIVASALVARWRDDDEPAPQANRKHDQAVMIHDWHGCRHVNQSEVSDRGVRRARNQAGTLP